MTCIKSKPVTPSSVLLRTHAHAHTHTHKQAQTNTHTHTHTLATAVLPLFELPLEVLFVMAVRPAVAFCWIPHIGQKRRIESVLDSLEDMRFGTAIICFTTKNSALRGRCDRSYAYGVLTVCCTVFRAYLPNGILTNLQKYPINTAIHSWCFRHKHAQIAQKTFTYSYKLRKYKSIGGSYLEITTGPDSVWSDTQLVQSVCKGNKF